MVRTERGVSRLDPAIDRSPTMPNIPACDCELQARAVCAARLTEFALVLEVPLISWPMSRLHARNPRSPPTTHNHRQPPSTSCDPPSSPSPRRQRRSSSPRPTFHFMPTLCSFLAPLLSTSSTPCLSPVHQGRMHRVHSFCLPRMYLSALRRRFRAIFAVWKAKRSFHRTFVFSGLDERYWDSCVVWFVCLFLGERETGGSYMPSLCLL